MNDPSIKSRRRLLRKHQTDAETRLWSKLRNKRFLGIKFFRQYSVGAYILDFYASSIQLAIELDGSQHAERKQQSYDARRTKYLKDFGIRVVRFWDNEVLKNTDGVLESVASSVTPPYLPLK
ncbi:MAG: endonuclease domain-containing protein [Patescibacteria group bacterium]